MVSVSPEVVSLLALSVGHVSILVFVIVVLVVAVVVAVVVADASGFVSCVEF